MTDDQVKEKILEKAKDGRLACKTALALAEELGVPPLKVGDLATRTNIKIVACQLGCFR